MLRWFGSKVNRVLRGRTSNPVGQVCLKVFLVSLATATQGVCYIITFHL